MNQSEDQGGASAAPHSPAAIPASPGEGTAQAGARRIAFIYALAGMTWIVASGLLVERLIQDRSDLVLAETIKGLSYILVTTVLVYWLARRALERTVRTCAQAQLESTQDLLEKVLASVGEAVIVVDPAGRIIVQCNPAAERVFGYDTDELIGKGTEILHVDRASHERFGVIGQPVLAAEGVFHTRYRMKRKDDTEIETENTVTTLRPDLGLRQGMVSVVRDVSEQVRTEQALRESERRYRLLADQTLDTIWAMDLDFRFTYVNPAVQRLLGYTPEEFVQVALPEICDRDTFARLRAVVESLVARGPGSDGALLEAHLRRLDGSEVPVEVHGAVIFDAGVAVSIQGTVRDISERVALEQQMRQSQRLESLGQLTGGVAHDFNNLLTVIMGNSDLLAEELDANSGLRPLVEMISSAAHQGGELTRRLLTFSRRQVLEPQVVDVNERVAGMEAMLRRTLGETVSVEVRPDPALWPALVDPSQLEGALLNLCINARDAMTEGGRLSVETANVRLGHDYADRHVDVVPGDYVMLAVTDSGCGIPQAQLERVFEPFFTTKQAGKGTGLGLSMVYGFVRQSRGHVKIESEPGRGTTVRLYLPRVG